MDTIFGLIVLVLACHMCGMIQVQRVPKLTSVFAATTAFSKKMLKNNYFDQN